MHIFKKSKIEKKKNIEQKSMKNRMFFGTSILKGFWEGFGRVLGGFGESFGFEKDFQWISNRILIGFYQDFCWISAG